MLLLKLDLQYSRTTLQKSLHEHLNVELLAGRDVCELRSIVVDISDQDVDGGSGVESRVALVSHHHPQTMLAVVLSVQCHPIDNFTWMGANQRMLTLDKIRFFGLCLRAQQRIYIFLLA